jgi:hypothetical protein
MEGFFCFCFLFLIKQRQSIHCKKKRGNSQWVFASKEMRFTQRPTTEKFPHHIFEWAAIFDPN